MTTVHLSTLKKFWNSYGSRSTNTVSMFYTNSAADKQKWFPRLALKEPSFLQNGNFQIKSLKSVKLILQIPLREALFGEMCTKCPAGRAQPVGFT